MYTQIQEILLLWILTKELNIAIINYIDLSINANVKRTQPTTGEVDLEFSGNYYNNKIGSVNNQLTMKWFYMSVSCLLREYLGGIWPLFSYPIIHAFWFKNSNVLNNSNSVCKIWINTQFCAARTRKAFRKKKRKL